MREVVYWMLVFLTLGFGLVQSGNILVLIGTPKYHSPGWTKPLLSALATRGHSLVVISTSTRIIQPGINNIHLKNDYDVVREHYIDETYTYTYKTSSIGGTVYAWYMSLLGSCKAIYRDNQLSPPKGKLAWALHNQYDLIMYDATYGMECLLRLLPMNNTVPIIGLSGGKVSNDILETMQAHDTINMGAIPHFLSVMQQPMDTYQRYENGLYGMAEFLMEYWTLSGQFDKLHKNLNGIPFIHLMLINTHPLLDFQISLPHNIIEIAGLHIKEQTEPLAPRISSFIKKYSDGVVLINVPLLEYQCKKFCLQGLMHMMKANKELGFIMPIDDVKERFKISRVRNALIVGSREALQTDILAHPNVKFLITHGDSFSLQDAIYYGVACIVVPVAFEQWNNAFRIHYRRLGIALPIIEFSMPDYNLTHAMGDVQVPEILEEIKAASKKFRAPKKKPVELALWYVEQVMADPTNFVFTSEPPLIWYHIRQGWYIYLVTIALIYYTSKGFITLFMGVLYEYLYLRFRAREQRLFDAGDEEVREIQREMIIAEARRQGQERPAQPPPQPQPRPQAQAQAPRQEAEQRARRARRRAERRHH